MAKIFTPEEIEREALSLAKKIKKNEDAKPGDQVDHSVTVLIEEDRTVMICGSAGLLEDMFVELLKKRPEMRQVLENAINRYGQRNTWKIS